MVVAFRSGSVHEWSQIDKLRLRILLSNSAAPLILSILGMVLASTDLDPRTVWRLSSLFAFITVVFIGGNYGTAFRRFSREEFKTEGGNRMASLGGGILGTAATLLQLYNVITLQTLWPFLVAIATLLLLAILQFILLVLAVEHERS